MKSSVLLAHHRKNNCETAGSWNSFESHRLKVTELACAYGGDSLALLGAGNCNDVVLADLSRAYDSVHLFDIDHAAVAQACAAQPNRFLTPEAERVQRHHCLQSR